MSHQSHVNSRYTGSQSRPGTASTTSPRLFSKLMTGVLAGLALPSMIFAAPAYADPVATVKARTQRMSDASLSAQQNGWYNPGDKVTLVCSKRGQAVKGFFSFNIPNGGWDNLWYRTSDNNYVADVDIETGTLKDVTSDCGSAGAAAPPPAQSSSKAANAVSWANSQIGSDAYDFACGKFVANAYGQPALGAPSALAFHDRLASQGRIHMDGTPPAGALVFSVSDLDVWNGVHQGHVDIAQADGTFVSGGVSRNYHGLAGAGHTVQVLANWNPTPGSTYLGWAEAPW